MKEQEKQPQKEETPTPAKAPYERPEVHSEPLFESAAAANVDIKGLQVECTS